MIQLGRLDSQINSSLGESIGRINPILSAIAQTSKIDVDKDFMMMYLFSSRGSFPFLRSLFQIDKDVPEFKFLPLFHIFTIMNLHEIVNDSAALDRIYLDIASSMSSKIKEIVPKGLETLVTDWDEVITGSNISDRIKVYNKLDITDCIKTFSIVSFISNMGLDLDKSYVRSFQKHFKKSPKNYFTVDLKMGREIAWSDNEEFYYDMDLRYPGIAAPVSNVVNGIIDKNAIPEFYSEYFKRFHECIGKEIGITNPMYKLLRLNRDVDVLYDERVILESSYKAFSSILEEFEERDLMKEKWSLRSRFSIDAQNGHVVRSIGKRDHIIMTRNKSYKSAFRDPFVMTYNPKNENLRVLDEALKNYLDNVDDGKNKFDPIFSRT